MVQHWTPCSQLVFREMVGELFQEFTEMRHVLALMQALAPKKSHHILWLQLAITEDLAEQTWTVTRGLRLMQRS